VTDTVFERVEGLRKYKVRFQKNHSTQLTYFFAGIFVLTARWEYHLKYVRPGLKDLLRECVGGYAFDLIAEPRVDEKTLKTAGEMIDLLYDDEFMEKIEKNSVRICEALIGSRFSYIV
jgi:hypothetical protein